MKTLYVTALVISFFSLVEGNVDKLIDDFPKKFNHFRDICNLILKESGAYNKQLLCQTKLFHPDPQNAPPLGETPKCLICGEECDAIKTEKETTPSDSKKGMITKNMSQLNQFVKMIAVHLNELCKEIPQGNKAEKCATLLFEEKKTVQIYVHTLCPTQCKGIPVKRISTGSCIYEDFQ